MFPLSLLRRLPLSTLVAMLVASFLFVCTPPAHSALEGVGASKIETFSGRTFKNDEFSLDPYLGKVPILLDFGSIYCATCVQSIPHLIVLQNKYGKDLKIVGVNLDTYGLGRVKKFFSSFSSSLNFPILIDRGLTISSQFDVQILPTYIIIDRDGQIVSTIVGYDEENRIKMDSIVDKVVKGEEITEEEKAPVKDVVILSPSNFTMSFQQNIWVIGLANGNQGPIRVRLNGGSEKIAKIAGDMFAARMQLSYGSNFIEVVYPKGEGIGTQAVVLFRDPPMGEGMGVNFPEYKFHTPERESTCDECHQIKPPEEESAMGMTTFCQDCHGYQTDQKFVHGPIPVGGCPACHDFNSTPQRYQLTEVGADLCFSCHGDIETKFAKDYVHGPVVMGFCTVCHSPHGSPYQFQLRNTQLPLCMGCHEDMREKAERFYPHEPVRAEQCTGCHAPHSSDNPNYFLKGNGRDLCLNCHSEQQMGTHTHPTDGPPPFDVPDMELDSEGNYICKSCHDPHASDQKDLFAIAGGCDGCHIHDKPPEPEPGEGEEEEDY